MPRARLSAVELEYETFGDLSKDTIVLMCGLGTQMIDWSQDFIDALQMQALSVVIFDNRDIGLSSTLEDGYELREMAQDVVELMTHLKLERAHIFGISLGGMVAQLVAYHYPERVRCLFSVMSSSGNHELEPESAEAHEKLMGKAPAGGKEGIIQKTAENAEYFGSPAYPESLEVRLARARRAYERCYNPAGVARQMMAVIEAGSRVERLREISAPTLVIHGAADPLIPERFGADTAEKIPGAKLHVIEGMGHNIPDALAADIAQRVGRFVRSSARAE